MKSIRSKLKSSQGVSIILAMVFMLICMFVGGTVLTAATVNSYRMNQKPKDKEFLNQRSAATLVADELRIVLPPEAGDTRKKYGTMRLMIHEDIEIRQDVTIKANGEVSDDATAPYETRTLRFEAVMPKGAVMTALQRTVIESTALNYMKLHHINPDKANIVFENVGELQNYNQMWLKQPADGKPIGGYIAFESPLSGIPAFNTYFQSVNKDNQHYHYVVDFGDYSQLEVRMYASVGENMNPEVEEVLTNSSGKAERVTRNTKLTVVSWTSPLIVKEGAV